MLIQIFGVTNKEHYGMLWYFLEWSIVCYELKGDLSPVLRKYFITALKISFRKAVFARNICIYGFKFNGFKTRMQSIDKIKNK